MNLFSHFRSAVVAALEDMRAAGRLPEGLDFNDVGVEPPRDPGHGDIATNAAMILARAARQPPRAIAEDLTARLGAHPDIASAEVAGPGFVNLRLRSAFWPRVVEAINREGEAFGRSNIGQGRRVNVEYVSANPTGPLHVGHCRGAVVGDALANLLVAAGFEVTREYYVNDAGAQIDALARSAYLRYREALGETIGSIPDGLYPGDYLVPVGKALVRQHGDALVGKSEAEWLPVVRDTATAMMLDLIRADLARLNIRHDVYFSELSLHSGAIAAAIEDLEKRGLVYRGRLPPPKGQIPDDWEDREQLLFRSSTFGDDVDRPLVKSDGSYTYFAADVAYFRSKFERGFAEMIFVLGADHGGYVKRLEAVARAVAGDAAHLVVRLCQLVKLFRDGAPVRMSKRAGDFVTLTDLVDEVGPDVVRFIMLTRRNDAPLDFDLKKALEQSRENPVFYVQYAHARICSVFRNAAEALGGDEAVEAGAAGADLSGLVDEAEVAIVRRLAEYPRVLESAAISHEPHRVAFYLYELASDFHVLWNRGKELPQLRFINSDERTITFARLAMLRAIRYVLGNGLRIIGVEPVTEM